MLCLKPNKLNKFTGKLVKKSTPMNPDIILVPCQKCINCRLNYAEYWANRAILEMKESDHNYFITFTYNEENLKYNNIYKNHIINNLNNIYKKIKESENHMYISPWRIWTYQNLTYKEITKEFYHHNNLTNIKVPTLNPIDMTKFIKKLRITWKRKYQHDKIKYILSGEYGTETFRPHYHTIFFNLPIHDLELKYTKNNNMYYISKEIEKLWNLGNILITKSNWETANYIARYIVNKSKGPKAGIEAATKGTYPSYFRTSRNPAIAKNYYEKNKHKIYKNDNYIQPKTNKSIIKKPLKYWDTLYQKEGSKEEIQLILNKIKRTKSLNDKIEWIEKQSNMNHLDYLKLRLKEREKQTKLLKNREIKKW